MINLEQLTRETAEKIRTTANIYIALLDGSDQIDDEDAIYDFTNIILSALNKAVEAVVTKQSEELSDRLYTAYDFLWGTLHYEQPCDCEDCVHVRTGLRKLAKFIGDAGGDIPDKKKIPPKE